MRAIISSFCAAVLFAAPAVSETVVLEADRDAALIEHPNGALANGSGPNFFVGRTGQDQLAARRALLRFDVASAVPRGAFVESAVLSVFMWPSNPDPRPIELHRVLAAWSEGPSSTSGGSGVLSEPGDVTWLHTHYDTEAWVHPGGHFVPHSSAELVIADSGFYAWPSTNQVITDVRTWIAAPERNFGWLLLGDEVTVRSVKSFASREHPDLNLRPTLTVTYRLPAAP